MTVKAKNKQDFIKTANNAVDHFHGKKEELIPILSKVNQEIGFIPKEAMKQISNRMHLPESQLISVASFYHMFYLQMTGRHIIKFCESAPCHVVDGQKVIDSLRNELNLEPGETSSDGKWTLTTTSCFGLCGVGPIVIVDEDIYSDLTPNQIPEILAKYE